MPIVDRESGGSIVYDRFCVVVDSPGVVAILMHESLRHRKVFVQPFAAMPFANQASKVTGLLEGFRDRPFA